MARAGSTRHRTDGDGRPCAQETRAFFEPALDTVAPSGGETTLFEFARVSTVGQTLEAQLHGHKAAGCQQIFFQKVGGARADRRELNRMLGAVAAGDVVVVTRIDRLARSTFDLFAIVKSIVDRKAQFRSLAEPWADTSNATWAASPMSSVI